jgi:uncharacterized oxidoreductase
MKFTGNTILITGATSGIGLAFAEHYHKAGSKVIICARRAERLKEISARLPGVTTRVCDISKEQQREALYNWAIQTHPELNIVMNNAGIQQITDLTKPFNLGQVREELETNLVAPLHLCSLFAKHLSSKKESALMNVSSGLAFVPISFMPVYCASKAALHSATLSLRHQLKATSVKVFEIIPPAVDTELGHQRRDDKTQSHGGMPLNEFLLEAVEAIEKDMLEAPVGLAKGLRLKREEAFEMLNK